MGDHSQSSAAHGHAMTRRNFGFGIVGAGVIAPYHAKAIAELPNARLVAVADPTPERGRALAMEFGAEDHTDVRELLARPDVDIVCVCVPTGLHPEVGMQVAAARKH